MRTPVNCNNNELSSNIFNLEIKSHLQEYLGLYIRQNKHQKVEGH